MTTVNLILWDNGVGLTRDMQILCNVWTAAGFEVSVSAKRRGTLQKWLLPLKLKSRMGWQRLRGDDPTGRFDFNVMLEHIRPEYLPLARCNVLIPNPEWFDETDRNAIGGIDKVFAKTHHAAAAFQALGCETHYLGFTSINRYEAHVPRKPVFFHLAGRSEHKGTQALLQLWLQHPHWPLLTVLQHPRMVKERAVAANVNHVVEYISDNQLRRLQNAHCFHLCPSETEGFGHYLVEALSAGAITLTLNAPPMHEIVGPDRGILVDCSSSGIRGLASTFCFDNNSMEKAVETALALTNAERREISNRAQAWFRANDAEFRRRAVTLLK